MSRRRILLAIGALAWAPAVLLALAAGRASPVEGATPAWSAAVLGGKPLDAVHLEALRAEWGRLRAAEATLHEKPAAELVVREEGAEVTWSLYSRPLAYPGLACRGFYLDQWTERMQGTASACRRLTPAARRTLLSASGRPPVAELVAAGCAFVGLIALVAARAAREA